MKTKKEWHRTTIQVTGRGVFPFDMLRYDNCVAIQPNLMEGRDERVLRLHRFSKDGSQATVGRWQSFGWTVTLDSAAGDLV